MNKEQKGFTMVEILVTLVMATLVIGSVTTGMVRMTKTYQMSYNAIENQYQAQIVLNTLIQSIKYSKGIVKVYGVDEDDRTEKSETVEAYLFYVEDLEGTYTYYLLEKNSLYVEGNQALPTDLTPKPVATKANRLARGIKKIQLTPKGNENFLTAQRIALQLEFGKEEQCLNVVGEVTIRNK